MPVSRLPYAAGKQQRTHDHHWRAVYRFCTESKLKPHQSSRDGFTSIWLDTQALDTLSPESIFYFGPSFVGIVLFHTF
jgi:hypothetical protein